MRKLCCWMSGLCCALLPLLQSAASTPQDVQPDSRRGIYAIWARDSQVAGLDFVRGGQIFLQWKDLQTGPGQYDFSELDANLQEHAAAGRPATIQFH